MAALAVVASVLAWRRSRYAAIPAAWLSALLLADAWFDCTTADRADLSLSLWSLGTEIPGSAIFLGVACTASDGRVVFDAPNLLPDGQHQLFTASCSSAPLDDQPYGLTGR